MDVKAAVDAYNAIAGITQNAPAANSPSAAKPADASFADVLTTALSNAVDSGNKAEKISALALVGKADLTELATAVSSAELALQTVTNIRDKVISAYQQIIQMPM